MVYITLIPPGGLLANKGEQGILREMHNIHVAIHLQEQKTWFLVLNGYFFFPRLLCYQNANRLRCPYGTYYLAYQKQISL